MHLRSLWMREAAGRSSALGNTVQASALAQEDTTTYSRHRLIHMNSHKTQRWNESVGRAFSFTEQLFPGSFSCNVTVLFETVTTTDAFREGFAA